MKSNCLPETLPQNAESNFLPTLKIKLIGGGFTLVDADGFNKFSKYAWRRVKSHSKYYAIRRIVLSDRTVTIRLHRQIAGTPAGLNCHHLNGDSLDNRAANLVNINPKIHAHIHKLLGRRRKNPGGSPEKNQDGRGSGWAACRPASIHNSNIDFLSLMRKTRKLYHEKQQSRMKQNSYEPQMPHGRE